MKCRHNPDPRTERGSVYGVDLSAKCAAFAVNEVARLRADYEGRLDPSFLTYGPKSRRAFLALRASAQP